MSLVKELEYSRNKPLSVNAHPDIIRLRSDNSDYKSGDTVRIEVPTGRSGMHLFPKSSYLEFSLSINYNNNNTAASAVAIDQSVYSLFKRMRVYHGSNTLEDTLFCNKIWTCIYDLQCGSNKRVNDTINLGVNEADNLRGLTITTVQNAQNQNTGVYNFTMQLPSSLLGSLSSKALPLSLMGASSIYLELELESGIRACHATTANLTAINYFTLSNIYYNAKVSILPYEIELAIIDTLPNGVINLPGVAYKSELKTISAGASSFNDKFAFQYSSVKNFNFFMQNSTSSNGTLLSLPVSQRPANDLKEYYLLLNGQQFPSQAVNNIPKMFYETKRAWDMTDNISGGILNLSNYTARNGANANTQLEDDVYTTIVRKRFLASIDLDRFNHSGETLMSGSNTIGQSLNLNLLFNSDILNDTQLYAFIMYDVNFKLEDGLLTAHF